ncbi:glycoside hydrolase family 15 [Cellulomonas sp. A375-1]|nr:glycoside hydrolase family 15 [Cellulomonas sp. A375-1]
MPRVPGDDARTTGRRRASRAVGPALLAVGAILAAVLPVGVQVGAARPAAAADAPAAGAPTTPYAVLPLFQEGVAIGPDGAVVAVPAGTRPAFLDGTRVLDPELTNFGAVLDGGEVEHGTREAHRLADAQLAWLAAGSVPGAGGPFEDLSRTALLDLHTLLLPGGAMVAGWEDRWRYVWPRDAAFVAVAFARTGHVDDALEVLDFLTRAQHDDGGFEARYLPDGSGPPDDRTAQTDGQGWAMWAAGLVLAELPPGPVRTVVAARLAPLVARAVDGTTSLLTTTGLPPASPDYWERDEDELTLGTVAPLVAGLEQAVTVLAEAGDVERAERAGASALTVRTATVETFGAAGFTRYADGADHDAAAAFVLAPFWQRPATGGRAAWLASAEAMRRPVGLAPAGEWRQDGVTWTPQTSLYAWVAAEQGDHARALALLSAIDSHRTLTGSVPEKVLADGRPAAVAPLTWSAACALLALDALDP